MVDRFLVWLGAGVVMAGVSAAVLAGSGVALATEGASDDGGKSTSESANSADKKDDSDSKNPSAAGPKDSTDDKKDDDGVGTQKDADDAKDEPTAKDDEDTKDDEGTAETTDEVVKDEDVIDGDETDGDETDGEVIGVDAPDDGEEPGEDIDLAEGTDRGTGSRSTDMQANDSQELKLDPSIVDDGSAPNTTDEGVDTKIAVIDTEPEPGQEQQIVPLASLFEPSAEEPEFSAVSFAAPLAAPVTATATAPLLNVLLDLVGTVIFGIYNFAIQLIGGPPMLPPGSTVTVRSSRLRLDCGCAPGSGETVPADWYVPQDPEPDRIIYLQHGFLAAAPWYSYTAATLAEQTHSIVVAPSITSNFLKYDQCWLGGAPMHQAMAGLFADGNTALADSALAAGYAGPIPDRVVLMGHSAGGAAVSGIAGYMTDNGSAHRLAGVVLLDGVGMNGKMADDLRKIDEFNPDLPIYQLAAPKYMWNMFGSGTTALMQARPDAEFYGVTLAGGSHVDSMRGGNWLIQFSQQLVAGFSRPQNVAAAQILMVGWVNDMFNGNQDEGIYLDSGETRTLDTSGGVATLVDLPNSLRRPYLLNFLEPFIAGSAGLFNIQPGCLRDSTGSVASCTGSVAA